MSSPSDAKTGASALHDTAEARPRRGPTDAPIPDLIATLGAQNKAKREQITGLKQAIVELRQQVQRADDQHEAAKVSKNAELLEFMKVHAQEQERKRAVVKLRQANAGKWQQIETLQAELAESASQASRHERDEAQARERRLAHAATVEAVVQRAELPQTLLADECAAVAARLGALDERTAAEARARAEQAEARGPQRSEEAIIGLLGRDVAGRALFDTIHRGVGGTESELRTALDALRENYVVFMDSYGFYQLL